ncbi:MAG: proprotein convertase P-domain-containing protein, partial [Bacteroidota bacterium]
MKRALLFCIALFYAQFIHAQQFFNIDQVDGMTLNVCAGSLSDSGTDTGDYDNNENFITTICPDGNSDPVVFFNVANFDILDGDQVCIFDGPDNVSPLIGCYNNSVPIFNSGVSSSASNLTGCLTVQFLSDGAGVGSGFQFAIGCQVPCQTVLAQLDATTPAVVPADTGYIDICAGDIVFFSGSGAYPENNIYYNQSDLTTSFEWNFGDDENNQGFGLNVGHAYEEPGGYIVQMELEDVEGCTNTNLISQRVRVAPPINFNNFSVVDNICLGDTITLEILDLETVSESFLPASVLSDTLFLPDGGGASFENPITFGEFAPGAVLTNINDLLSVCVNIEHSYMRDIEVVLECPDGTEVILQNQINAGPEIFLGIPNENDGGNPFDPTTNPPGTGFDYCWTPTSTNGTWTQFGVASGLQTLPPDIDYSSFEPLDGLLGCPLNGDWILRVTDNFGIDNGWIFSWEINFNPALFPAVEVFEPEIASAGWISDGSTVFSDSLTTIVAPLTPGTASYTFEVTNSFGCTYDTTFNITVNPPDDPACATCSTLEFTNFDDAQICENEPFQLAPGVTGLDSLSLFCNSSVQTIIDGSGITPIPGNPPPPDPLSSTITVSGLNYTTISAGDIQSVCIDISHPWVSDMDVFLESPDGILLQLTT